MSNRTSAFAASSTRRGFSAYQIYQESSNYSTVGVREERNAKNTFTVWEPSSLGTPYWRHNFGSFLVFCVYNIGVMKPMDRISSSTKREEEKT